MNSTDTVIDMHDSAVGLSVKTSVPHVTDSLGTSDTLGDYETFLAI